jgi:hypothetical protein
MKTVWKKELKIEFGMTDVEFLAPKGAKLLTVANQNDAFVIWYLVDEDLDIPLEKRKLLVVGTGHKEVPDNAEYIGTAMFYNGSLVLHVFEVK